MRVQNRIACIVREVSKIYEQAVTAPLSELYQAVTSGQIPAKGEIVILLDGKPIEKKTKKAFSMQMIK
jgi:16S rRNA C1402 (ribose-2'-O) methylase RsmI